MKIRNFTIKYTDCKTINSNNSVKFEVNWPRGETDGRTVGHWYTIIRPVLKDERIKTSYIDITSTFNQI